MPRRIVIITISLAKERVKKPNKEIEEDVLEFLKKSKIPWMEKVEKVTVLGSNED